MDDSILEALPIFFFLIILYGLLGAVGFASYIMRGIGILRMSESRGLQNGWLGFIPFAAEYQLGKISGEVEFGKRTIKKPGIWLLLFPIITYGIFFVGYFALLFGIISFADSGRYMWDASSPSVAAAMIIGIVIFYLLFYIGAIIIYLLKGLVFHRIFKCYGDGQMPVFHTLICLFVPLGEAILLLIYGKKHMSRLPMYMTTYTPGYPDYQRYQQQYQQYYYGNVQQPYPQYVQPAQPPMNQGVPEHPPTNASAPSAEIRQEPPCETEKSGDADQK